MAKKKKQSLLSRFVNFFPKRIRVVISTVAMSVILLSSTFTEFASFWWLWIIILMLSSYLFAYFAIFDDIDRVEWIMLFVMPVFFTVTFYLFTMLFPMRWITRIPFILVYMFCFYAALLTSNIFNVGVDKSIQLYRAAFSVNYLFQTFVIYLAIHVLFTFKPGFMVIGLVSFLITVPLIAQLCWTVKPDAYFERDMLRYVLMVSFIIMQFAVMLSFVPMILSISALAITACYYSLSGIIYHHLDQRLFKQTVREYVIVIIFVTAVALLTIQW